MLLRHRLYIASWLILHCLSYNESFTTSLPYAILRLATGGCQIPNRSIPDLKIYVANSRQECIKSIIPLDG
jgi:hypothetical protein